MSSDGPSLLDMSPMRHPVGQGAAAANNHSGSPPPRPLASAEAAADLIKTLDDAFAEMNNFAVSAAREAEDARRNAQVAQELACRYQSSNAAVPTELVAVFDVPVGDAMADESLDSSADYSTHARAPESAYRSLNGSFKHDDAATPSSHKLSGARQRISYTLRSPPTTSAKTRANAAAHRHAEDVLELSLDLERAQKALEKEQMAHDETKVSLGQTQNQISQLNSRLQRLQTQAGSQHDDTARQLDLLSAELQRAQQRVSMAEEDAQLALELAMANAEAKQQADNYLQQALIEIDRLRSQMVPLPATAVQATTTSAVRPPPTVANTESVAATLDMNEKHVRFAVDPHVHVDEFDGEMPEDDNDLFPEHAPRPSVLAGRRLLQLVLASRNGASGSVASTSIGGGSTSAASQSIISTSNGSLMERRQRLKTRLSRLQVSVEVPASQASLRRFSGQLSPLTPSSNVASSPASHVANDVANHAARILRASGRRLHLVGRWWTESGDTDDAATNAGDVSSAGDYLPLDVLVRHYCTAVEMEIERKQQSVVELESLCALWEQSKPDGSGHMSP